MQRHVNSLVSHLTMRLTALRHGLAQSNLRRIQAASLAHNSVEYAVIVALSVWAFDQGGAAGVGLVTVIRTLPALLSGPLLSVLTDRRSRVAALVVGFTSRVITTLGLAVAVAAGHSTAVYVLAALDAVVASIFYPAYGALVPELATSPDDLATANAMASATENIGTMLGPALAAVILVVGSPAIVFVASAATIVVAAGVAATLRSDRRPPAQRGDTGSFFGAFRNGLSAVRRNRGSGVVIGSWAYESVVIGMSEVFIVVVAFELTGWGDPGVGWLNAALGAGGLAGSIAMASLARDRPFGRYLAIGIAMLGVGVAASSVPLVVVVLLAHVTMGIAAAQVDVAAMTLLQRTVPEDELSRVLGVFEGIYWGALGAGAALASWMVIAFGIRPALLIAGVGCAVIGLVALPRLHAVDALVDVPEDRLALLRRIPVFSALPVPTRERLARRMHEQELATGEALIHEGATEDRIFVVAAGEMDVRHDDQLVATLRAADIVGEIAAIRHTPRTATVTATSPAVVLTLDGDVFVDAVAGHSIASAEVETLVDQRIGQLRRLGSRTGR